MILIKSDEVIMIIFFFPAGCLFDCFHLRQHDDDLVLPLISLMFLAALFTLPTTNTFNKRQGEP
jgi:hypothetical protein